jgi:hypothetical protein
MRAEKLDIEGLQAMAAEIAALLRGRAGLLGDGWETRVDAATKGGKAHAQVKVSDPHGNLIFLINAELHNMQPLPDALRLVSTLYSKQATSN